jgi:hypothetical protein
MPLYEYACETCGKKIDTAAARSVRRHAAENAANDYTQQGISGVVRGWHVVHAIFRDQFLESSL